MVEAVTVAIETYVREYRVSDNLRKRKGLRTGEYQCDKVRIRRNVRDHSTRERRRRGIPTDEGIGRRGTVEIASVLVLVGTGVDHARAGLKEVDSLGVRVSHRRCRSAGCDYSRTHEWCRARIRRCAAGAGHPVRPEDRTRGHGVVIDQNCGQVQVQGLVWFEIVVLRGNDSDCAGGLPGRNGQRLVDLS